MSSVITSENIAWLSSASCSLCAFSLLLFMNCKYKK
jgi:hypothetical protein